jgi:hypothetical protein
MIRRYIPGKGYVNLGVKDNKVKIIKSYSTLGGLCDLGSESWNSTLSCCNISNGCYTFPILDGGIPGSIFALFMDGGDPISNPVCFIDGGNSF